MSLKFTFKNINRVASLNELDKGSAFIFGVQIFYNEYYPVQKLQSYTKFVITYLSTCGYSLYGTAIVIDISNFVCG